MDLNKTMRVIYDGGYVPDLGIQMSKDSGYFGWLMFKHPDGQWVTLAPLKNVLEDLIKEEG